MNIIAQNIDARMKADGLNIMFLEAKAGLKPHAVRNIVTGKSKNPSAVNLHAIADALGCSVKDLLETPKALHQEDSPPSVEEILQDPHVSSLLMGECVQVVEALLQKNKKTITTAQYLTYVREVYLHSLQKSPASVNTAFAEWFIDLMKSIP